MTQPSKFPWREVLFWAFLLAPFSALNSPNPRRQIAGAVEAGIFVIVALLSLGKLQSFGLQFIVWEPVPWRKVLRCIVFGFLAGGALVLLGVLIGKPIGLETRWNRMILALVLGPVMEEIVFRGYLLALVLYLTKRWARTESPWPAVSIVAIIFALAHPVTTVLAFACVAATGILYGWVRIRYRSTPAAVLTHAVYNIALYLSLAPHFWR